MKFLLFVSAWLAFAAIASAQDCRDGRCSTPTVTYYFAPTPQASRYLTLQPAPVPTYVAAPVVYYRSAPRPMATPIRSGIRGFFGCR